MFKQNNFIYQKYRELELHDRIGAVSQFHVSTNFIGCYPEISVAIPMRGVIWRGC